jgi:hypothetical protein
MSMKAWLYPYLLVGLGSAVGGRARFAVGRAGAKVTAWAYVIASVVVGLGAVRAGLAVTRSW